MSGSMADASAEAFSLGGWRERAIAFEAAVSGAVLGQQRVVRLMTIAILARGHVLLEGDVGVGKTTLLRAVARAIGGPYERVEGTIDLMPGDLIYHAAIGDDGKPRLEPGPVLQQGENLAVFFFNEINRARPQVHSLLLRLMAERSVTAFNREILLPHLLVFADRNRLEREETYELPAAARDRFFMEIPVETPADDTIRRQLIFDRRFHDVDSLIGAVETNILPHTTLDGVARAIQARIHSSDAFEAYVVRLWNALRYPGQHGIMLDGVDMDRLVQGGASPRGLSYLVRAARVNAFLNGRDMVVPEDLRAVFMESMAHRIFLDPLYELRRETLVPALCRQVLERVPAP
ncbi:Methanol dehydrogenase regulatory protein MoxR [Granulibacter bethesdensis]|nr:Methanol dehydrogenase regulatory protein MoxR [Granulibacter bethesdensis]